MDQLVSLLSGAHEAEVVPFAVNNADRLVSDWDYAANTSNQARFGSYTLALAAVLGRADFPADIAAGVAKKLVQQHLKSIYRFITNIRQAQTIPVLSLLRQIARFIPQELFTEFDFTLRAIPKILSQQPYRGAFLEFYMELIRHAAPPTRRELFANRKVFQGWIGKLGLDDDTEAIDATLDVLHEHVLRDKGVFTKSTKMGLFNDWTLKNMQRLLAQPHTAASTSERVARMLVLLLTDRTYGVRMPGEPKLALSLLKIVKPWENAVQMDLVVRLLRELPEVFAAYFDMLSSTYSLVPKESMWWFSFTVLHVRALKLPITGTPTGTSSQVVDSVVPKTVARGVLTQGLTHANAFVRFQAVQIALFAVRRLKLAVARVEAQRGPHDAQQLIGGGLARLPELAALLKTEGPPLLRTTCLLVVNEVCQLRPQPVSVPIALGDQQVRGLDLVQAETVLEVQTYTGDQSKWWMAAHGRPSLFTQLLKFATYNPELAAKSSGLLQHLVHGTQLFADRRGLAHPVDALLYTLGQHSGDGVWRVLDQAVQRAVKAPYQYIDRVQSENVSPLAVAVAEQQRHVAEQITDAAERATLRRWVAAFARALTVLGESPWTDSQQAGDAPNAPNAPNAVESNLNDYFDFVLDAPSEAVKQRKDVTLKISTHLELAATLSRAFSDAALRSFLLASLPPSSLALVAATPAAFEPFVAASGDVCAAFLAALGDASSPELASSLEASPNWPVGLSRLSTRFIVAQLAESPNAALLCELNRRRCALDVATFHALLGQPELDASLLDAIADNLNLWATGSVGGAEGLDLMMRITHSAKLVASLVRASGRYPQKHPLSLHPLVLVAGVQHARSEVDDAAALGEAQRLMETQHTAAALPILAALRADIPRSSVVWTLLPAYIEANRRAALDKSLLALSLDTDFTGRYLKIAVNQLTRQFSERRLDGTYLAAFNAALAELSLWDFVHHNAVNSLVEAAVRHGGAEAWRMVALVSSRRSAKQLSLGQLTELLSVSTTSAGGDAASSSASGDAAGDAAGIAGGDDNVALTTALYFLYTNNPDANSTLEVEQAVLALYGGTTSATDRLLASILQQIEAHRQRSWMDNLQSLDVRPAQREIDDYALDPLVVVKRGKVYVMLDETVLRDTIQNFEALPPFEPGTTVAELEAAVAKYTQRTTNTHYDSSFVLGIVASEASLLDRMELFLSSGLISLLIANLADPTLADLSLQILTYVAAKLPETQFKDQVGLRLLLGKLLMLQATNAATNSANAATKEALPAIPPHIPGIAAQIALVLTTPSHFMHDKVARWLLASPQIYAHEVPLFKPVLESSSDMKLRELTWLVNMLKCGAVDRTAIDVYTRHGIIDWLLAHMESDSPKMKVFRETVIRFFERIEELCGVSVSLISNNGVLANEELRGRVLVSAGLTQAVKAVAK